jgi:hypothetical protein
MATIRERLNELSRRLTVAAAPSTADEAFDLICRTLEEVEDELRGIPKQTPPPPLRAPAGRLYPPQADRIVRHPDGSLTARTRRHVILVGAGGSIAIVSATTGVVEFTKSGVAP